MDRCGLCGRYTYALIVRERPPVRVGACLVCDRVDLWHQLAPATRIMADAAHRQEEADDAVG